MAIMEVSVVTVGSGSPSQGDVVAETVKVAKRHGAKFALSPMGTALEGDLDALLEIAREMHEVCFNGGTQRVITTIRIDDRRDKELSMEYKVDSVMAKVQ
ncbi:hypothetical protein AMK68_03405 [candidate division KD3-62 bacterium DG_56]|uniref:Thiamine-binding protein domain-containing protein n=1 Tax=candidate division KD3-62 bacterium DG_56 TaxID=1704032 RepID=A0A0S7XN74_9BACT|nr:MAG: hypothetical protein AMK68_03405 [candidate division KD3-62 bacterium DG_56]